MFKKSMAKANEDPDKDNLKKTAYNEIIGETVYSSGDSDGLFIAAYNKLNKKDRRIRTKFLWKKLYLKAHAASKILGAL